ncbi:hypothetical protein TWF569_005755 [Orbilia oligospora]|uniref:Uncharacterized protein n=1 Tax=Orbilia oligospora TaxID=2813651 RepID=A0A7C8N204_ORBOL|nr:hypothetical protein TWF102_003835 [Orbilia oligospora]KAF3128670.1 hypothetical protein TWF703_009251 [Orbilia oligospora]KAF3148415.1 hypothetical protein TWF569_005755 [Orbilia oligospora]
MGNANSKQYHSSSMQPVTLCWNDELIGSCTLSELYRNFPRLRRGFHNFDPRGDRHSRSLGQVTIVYDLAPLRDVVLWARPPEPQADEARLVSPTRFGGSEALRIVVFTLFRRIKNGQTYNVRAALTEAFTAGYPFRHEFGPRDREHELQPRHMSQYITDEDLGLRDISAYLTLLESFVEVSITLECLDNGQNPTREHIENSYLKYRKHIKHNLSNIEESLRFLRLGDLLAHTQMMQDFTFPVLSSYDTLFKRYNTNSHNITFAQYGERQWNLSRRLCDYLELEHNEFQKRKKAREVAILAETPRPHIGLEETLPMATYDESQPLENSVFITLSPQILQKIIESSPVTVDPTQSTYQIISQENLAGPQLQITSSGNNHKDYNHDHVVIQLRIFQTPSKHSLGMQSDRITPSHTPIPSRRGSPAPSEYFFGPHQDHHHSFSRPNNIVNGAHTGIGIGGRLGINRNNTFHTLDDYGFPATARPSRDDFDGEHRRFNKDDRFRGRRMPGGPDDLGIGLSIDGGRFDGLGRDGVIGHGFDVQTMVARMMAQAVREEKKRDYVMPWQRNGGSGPANGQKLIGYTTGEGYR